MVMAQTPDVESPLTSDKSTPDVEAAAISPLAASDEAVLDEVLVTGEQPGPGLWQITKGDRTVWILGTYEPLPKKMTWRSSEVESIVAESQRLVQWVNIDTDVDIGFFAGMAALPYVFTAGNNPDGAKLKDVVSPEAYEQWLPLNEKYIGRDNDIEKIRPSFAALELKSKAIEAAGLSSAATVWSTVEKLAKKHKVKILRPEVEMEIKVKNPRAVIKKFRKTHLADAECFAQSIAHLESDLDALRARANAWSIGNVDALRKIPPPDPGSDCAQMLQHALLNGNLADEVGARESLDRMVKDFQRVGKEQQDLWIHTIENELANNTSILAVMPLIILFDPQGPLQMLRERGYQVIEP
jgi:uncharacterized protein YbaP (TraB family)